tara:strand:+ start:3211 stop:3474 length:264 start_codon:yes stop_codon:yes gene_type:complete
MLRQHFKQLSLPVKNIINNINYEIYDKHFNNVTNYVNPGGICRNCKGSGWITKSDKNISKNNNNNIIILSNMFKFDLCKDCNGTGLN